MVRPERQVILEYGDPVLLPAGTGADADRLARHINAASRSWQKRLGLPGFVQPLDARPQGGKVSVKARGVTGTVVVGPYELVIAPKYLAGLVQRSEGDSASWERALAALVAVGTGARHLIDGTVSAQAATTKGFVELFARSYVRALQVALDEGLPRRYALREDRLPVVRGRVAVERLYPRFLYAPHEVPVEYPDYVRDVPVNRLLRWAAGTFARLPIRPRTASHLLDLSARMGTVPPDVPTRLEIERIRLAPQHRHVQPALQLARWLAEGRYGSPGAGDATVPGLLLHSDRVFEAFVLAVTASAGRQAGYQFRRAEHKLAVPDTAAHPIPIKPDGELLRDGEVACVMDAKYKVWDKHPKTSDVYQVMAGARVLGAPDGALVYPSPSRREPQSWTVEGGGDPARLVAWFVTPTDLAEPGGYARVVEALRLDMTRTLKETSPAPAQAEAP